LEASVTGWEGGFVIEEKRDSGLDNMPHSDDVIPLLT
jgi:hypothetical protein